MIVCDYLKLHPQSDMAFRVPQKQRQSSKVQYFFLQTYQICYMVHMGAPCPLYGVHLKNKTRANPQKAPISVPHPWADLADSLKPLRWAAGDPRGAKGLKETSSGAEDDEVEEEEEEVEGEEEEGVRRGRGEALVALWGDGWVGLEGPRAGDAAREGTLWTVARAVGARSGGGPCWHPARGARRREAGDW